MTTKLNANFLSRNKREVRGDTRPRQDEDVDLVTVYTDVYNMRIELEKMRKPIGTRDSPARSCKDLSQGHSKLEDGKSNKFQQVRKLTVLFLAFHLNQNLRCIYYHIFATNSLTKSPLCFCGKPIWFATTSD
jgi:hypothetical protein